MPATEQTKLIIISIVFILVLLLLAIGYMKMLRDDKNRRTKNFTPSPNSIMTLYDKDFNVLKVHEDVYVSHWDKNIYVLYTHDGGTFIMSYHLAEDITMTLERVQNNNQSISCESST